MFQRLLVPLDGSDRAERAIPVAARIARAFHGSIVFMRVVLPVEDFETYEAKRVLVSKPEAYEVEMDKAARYLIDEVTTAYVGDLLGIEIEMDVVSGAVSPSIFSIACLENIDLIVMCSHGETGLKRWVLGSVAQEAVRHSPVPMLILNEHGAISFRRERPLQALVALDGSPLSETVLEPAARLLAALTAPAEGTIHLLRVVDIPSPYGRTRAQAYIDGIMQKEAKKEAEAYLKAVTIRLHESSLKDLKLKMTSSVVVSTDVAGAIIKRAEHPEGEEGSSDLIAMATHGRKGVRRVLMGSVTEHVLGSTTLPLFIVRPTQIEAQAQREVREEEIVAGEETGEDIHSSAFRDWRS